MQTVKHCIGCSVKRSSVTVLLPEVWQCRKMENIITVSILYILTARCSIMIKSIYLLMEERINGLLPERKGWW